jgi:hypothetical protein
MKKILIIATAGLTLFLSGCGKAAEPFNDAPVSGENTGAAEKINMPDGFSNVATKCDHGNRIYVAFHGDSAYAAIAVVPNDPSCEATR